MGKTSHKSRKRKRSSSRDRFRGLEEKISGLIKVLTHREVRSLRGPSVSTAQGDRELSIDRNSIVTTVEDTSRQNSVINGRATPARQEGPSDPQTSGSEGKHSSEVLSALAHPPTGEVILADNAQPSDLEPSEDIADTLTKELFGFELEGVKTPPWNDLVLQKWSDLTCNGMIAEQRELLLKKYFPSEALVCLKAPRLNPECKSGLNNNSVVKRDEFSCRNQDQVGIALCAFGEAISKFLRPDIQHSLAPEARTAVTMVYDGARILADLFFRLSLSRRAQIKPAFNLLTKTTAEAIPADTFLFGTSFGEEIKKASTMQKSAKEIVKPPLSISTKIQQPIKQPAQVVPARSGNARAPARNVRPSATRRAGASSSSRRVSFRHRSHSRRR